MAEETEEQKTEALRKFVTDVCDGRVVTSAGMELDDIRSCFMILALMEPGQMPKDTAIVWEYLDKAAPRSMNGMPCFFSCHFMTIETWKRAHAAIKSELERRKTIAV